MDAAPQRNRAGKSVFCVLYPCTERFIDRFFEGLLAGLGRNDLGTEHFHAEHVELLAFHVHGTHVNGAFHAHECSGGGSGNAVLSGTGLGNDLLFAHALGEQNLADGIVDLVCAEMVQVFALQVDFRAAQLFSQVFAEI